MYTDFDHLIEDEKEIQQFKERLCSYIDQINTKVNLLHESRRTFSQKKLLIQNEINSHFDFIVNNIIINIKNELEQELEKDNKKLENRINDAIIQADHIKSQFEKEFKSYEQFLNNFRINQEKNNKNPDSNRNPYDTDFNEEDALMINDSVNEFSLENNSGFDENRNQISSANKELKMQVLKQLEPVFTNLDILSGEVLLADSFFDDKLNMNYDPIKLVKCVPDLTSLCFGHLKKENPSVIAPVDISSTENNMQPNVFSSIDLLDHTKFVMDKELNSNSFFRKSESCNITFDCPDTNCKHENETSLYNLLQVDLYDSQDNSLAYDLKERCAESKRFIRVRFVPKITGVHKLVVKYKHAHIPNSPFYFSVFDPSSNNQTQKQLTQNNFSSSSIKSLSGSSLVMQNSQQFVKSESIESNNGEGNLIGLQNARNQQQYQIPQKTVADKIVSNLIESTQNRPFDSNLPVSSIFAGRGKALREMKLNLNGNKFNNSSIKSAGESNTPQMQFGATSQKRKGYEQIDSNNSQFNSDDLMQTQETDDSSVRELSTKLKKVVYLNEAENPSINTLMGLNLNISTEKSNQSQNYINGQTILSNHLKKYSTTSNGLVRLIDDKQIPSIRAQFQRKFSNCYYPIGVRVCKLRNWLIVCDSGNNAVKVFERTTGELLHEIKENKGNSPFSLQRPSAVLINQENNSEIYIKDDKEILVFDLERNCQFVRKFGFKILKRPYGLAFNPNGNLVLVDADLKNPSILTFDQNSGKLLSSKPFEPVLPDFSQSTALNQLYSGPNKSLSNDIMPFEKTKVRFIYCNQDHLYAADLGRSIVFKTNLNGETELAFGHYGKKKGEFVEPSGIHVDNDGGAILVGDSKNDRLQVYDAQGKYKCDIEFLDDKIVRPSDIHIDSDGYLYVSCFIQHCVKKFKLIVD